MPCRSSGSAPDGRGRQRPGRDVEREERAGRAGEDRRRGLGPRLRGQGLLVQVPGPVGGALDLPALRGHPAQRILVGGAFVGLPGPDDQHAQRQTQQLGGRWSHLAQAFGQLVQAQVVPAAFHAGRRELHVQRALEERNVLEEDLLLKVLRAGRDEHALAAQDRGDEVRERLARSGAGFGEQHRPAFERARDRLRHRDLAVARLESGNRARQRSTAGERLRDEVD